MLVLPVDDVEDVPPLEADAQFVARDVQVVVRVVVKVGAVVKLAGGGGEMLSQPSVNIETI